MSQVTIFPLHTIESAPSAAGRAMTAIADHWGFVPDTVAKLATSPRSLDGLLNLSAAFEGSALDPVSREVLALTVATRNGCHCVALHRQRLDGLGADPGLVAALRVGNPLDDPRLEALHEFVLRVLDTTGNVGDEALRAFLAHGYTTEQALEVVLGIGAHALSTLANRLVGAEFDNPLADYAWEVTPARQPRDCPSASAPAPRALYSADPAGNMAPPITTEPVTVTPSPILADPSTAS